MLNKNGERALAHIERITEKKPIPGADKICLYKILGWNVISGKEDFTLGDLVVYFEIDSVLPDKPEFAFLRDKKFRVKTIKLRGEYSQGLIMPLSILPKRYQRKAKEGLDVTNVLQVTKYDKQLEKEMREEKKGLLQKAIKYLMRYQWFRDFYKKHRKFDNTVKPFPSWIHKTDEERIENMPKKFDKWCKNGVVFYETEKLDGSSTTFYVEMNNEGKEKFGVCSRNLELTRENVAGKQYFEIYDKLNIEIALSKLRKMMHATSVILQGEMIGPGIQKNKYNLKELDFKVFNLYVDNEPIDFTRMEMLLKEVGLDIVPLVGVVTLPDSIDELKKLVQGKSLLNNKQNREGSVFRNWEEKISFKCINPMFLLKDEE